MKISRLFSLPIRDTVRHYSLDKGRKDLISGLTVALLSVPQCMAYAYLAGLPPYHGLYAGLAAVVTAAIFGSNEHMNTGPTASICVVVGGIVAGMNHTQVGTLETVMILSLLVGGFQILIAALELGNLARFVSRAVITGFIVGVVGVIIGDQILNLMHAGSASQSPFFIYRAYEGVMALLGNQSLPTGSLLMGGGAIVLMTSLRMIHNRIPAGLITISAGALLAYSLNLQHQGIELIGHIPSGLPSLQLPGFYPSMYTDLVSGALALTILTSIQAVSISRSIASESRQPVDENQDLIGQGTANIASGLFQGFPISASFSRSFFNYSIGAQTRFSSLFCGLFFAAIILFATDLAYYIPMPVLYGLIIVAVSDAFNWQDVKMSFQATRRDQFAFLSTMIGALVLKLDWAIYLGVIVSLIFYIRKATRLDLKEYILDKEGELKQITEFSDRLEPRVALIDVNGEAFFGSADQIKQRIENLINESDKLKVIVLRMKNAMNLDVTGAQVLREIAQRLKERDRTLMLCGTTPKIREVLLESGVVDIIGQDKILVAQKSLLTSTRQAIKRAQAHIDTVLEGEEARSEEDPPLKHTMEQLENDPDEDGEVQDPVKEEKVTPTTAKAEEEEVEEEDKEEENKEKEKSEIE